jgi:hypothetical protein
VGYPSLKVRGVTVAQFPNPPLIVAVAAAIVGFVVAEGSTAHDFTRAVLYVALSIWAWEEAHRGVGWFRRALGIAGLVYVVFALGGSIG